MGRDLDLACRAFVLLLAGVDDGGECRTRDGVDGVDDGGEGITRDGHCLVGSQLLNTTPSSSLNNYHYGN